MAASSDWLPGSRAGVLVMCRKWISYMTAERRTAWGIPQDQFTELQGLCDAADTPDGLSSAALSYLGGKRKRSFSTRKTGA